MKKFHWDYQKIRHCKRKDHILEDRAREMFSNGSTEWG